LIRLFQTNQPHEEEKSCGADDRQQYRTSCYQPCQSDSTTPYTATPMH